MNAWNFNLETRAYTLHFNVWSFAHPRQLEVLLDGERLGTWTVGDEQRIAVPVTLTSGPHRLELRSPDGPTSPASLGDGSNDGRLLGFGVAELGPEGR